MRLELTFGRDTLCSLRLFAEHATGEAGRLAVAIDEEATPHGTQWYRAALTDWPLIVEYIAQRQSAVGPWRDTLREMDVKLITLEAPAIERWNDIRNFAAAHGRRQAGENLD